MTKGIKVNDLENPQQEKPHKVKNGIKNKFARVASALLLLGGCGYSESTFFTAQQVDKRDVLPDGGTVQRDGDTDVTKCDYSAYTVLKIGENTLVVMEGASVDIGGKKYAVNKAQDGSVVLHSEEEFYVVRDKETINGVDVSYLGSGTTLTNAALLQVEYYLNGNVATKNMSLSVNERMKYDIDSKHYVEVKLRDAVSAEKEGRKVEYVNVDVELFVRSSNGDSTFISAKKGTYTVGAEEVRNVVLDEETGLAVNIDLLSVGTENAIAKLGINGKEVVLGQGEGPYKVKIGNTQVEVAVLEVYHSSDGISEAALLISSPTKSVVNRMRSGEKVNLEVDDSGQRLHIEMLGSEPVCNAE
ncbi:MAG: hypothetical protein QW500_00720 [Candidatus Micrarchaeia archaeon]